MKRIPDGARSLISVFILAVAGCSAGSFAGPIWGVVLGALLGSAVGYFTRRVVEDDDNSPAQWAALGAFFGIVFALIGAFTS